MLPTVPIHSLNLKSQTHMDISLQLKQNHQEPALDKFLFSLRIANLWNSLPPSCNGNHVFMVDHGYPWLFHGHVFIFHTHGQECNHSATKT